MTNDTSPHGPRAPREKSKRTELQELRRLTEEGQRQQEIDRMMAEAKANGLPLSIVQHHRAGERMISRTDLQDFADNIGALLHCTPSTAYASLHDAHQRGMEILASHVGTPRMAPDYYMAAARHAAKTPEFYTAMRSLMIAHKMAIPFDMAFLRRLNLSSHSAPALQQQTELTQMEEIQHAQSAISDEAVPDHVKTVPLDAYAQLQLDMLRTASRVPGLPPVASRLNAWNPEERMNARSARTAERILSRADETLVKLRAAAQQPEKSWTDAVSEEALRLVHARHSGRE